MDYQDNQKWHGIFKDLMTQGKEVTTRGLKTLEIENYHVDFMTPEETMCIHASRGLNFGYIAGEFCWYLRGNNSDTAIIDYSKFWEKIHNKDSDKWPYKWGFNSNYGQYIFKSGALKLCASLLAKDKYSRKASIPIDFMDLLFSDTKDRICTNAIMFRIRDDALNMTVHMRSNDAIFGLCNDAPIFSFIHQMLFRMLETEYPDLRLGTYHHTAASFHLYENKIPMVEEILRWPFIMPINKVPPRIYSAAEAEYLMKTMPAVEYAIRADGMRTVPKVILDEYPFACWLTKQLILFWRKKNAKA